MKRITEWVILCEDDQQEAFVARFLQVKGVNRRRIRRVSVAPGCASGFVRDGLPYEIQAYRCQSKRKSLRLIVAMDADNYTVEQRLSQLMVKCRESGIEFRKPNEKIAILIPRWSIETWLAYLQGCRDVTEDMALKKHGAPFCDCRREAEELNQMCNQGALTGTPPASLEIACEEYRKRIQ